MGFKSAHTSQGALKQAKVRREHFAQKSVQQRKQQNDDHKQSESASSNKNNKEQQKTSSSSGSITSSNNNQTITLVPPSNEQAKFILENINESILIPKASEDLRRLFLNWAYNSSPHQSAAEKATATKSASPSSSRRRQRGEEESQDENHWEEISSAIQKLLPLVRTFAIDELASSVICALLRAGEKYIERTAEGSQGESKTQTAFYGYVQEMIQKIEESTTGFLNGDEDAADAAEENNEEEEEDSGIAALSKHHIGRRVVCALIEAGSPSIRKQLNKILAARTLFLINHRHGSVCLIRLLELYPKSAKTIAPAALENLQTYLNAPVSERVCEAMVSPQTGVAIVNAILETSLAASASAEGKQEDDDEMNNKNSNVAKFLNVKRNLRFLSRVMDDGFAAINNNNNDDTQQDSKSSVACLTNLLEKLKPFIPAMCLDERGNIFVQAFIRAVGAVNNTALSQSLIKIILNQQPQQQEGDASSSSASISDLLLNQHAVHVIIALATSGGSVMSNEVANILRPHLKKLVLHQHGSLAVRKFVEGGSGSNNVNEMQKRGEKLLDMIDGGLITQMISNDYGNMVVQSLLKALSQAKRIEFYKKYVAPKLVEFCQNQFASRVVFLLVDGAMLDAATQQAIFVALKPHILDLAQHLNGRYIIEQMIVPHREVKEILTTNFIGLANSRGSQQVLVKLYESADPATRVRLANLISANLETLATSQFSSIVLQKLLQSDLTKAKSSAGSAAVEILEAVRKLLGLNVADGSESNNGSNTLLQRLRGDFFGRFVVSLAQGQEMQQAPSGNNNKSHGGSNDRQQQQRRR